MSNFRRAINSVLSAILISALLANGAQAADPIRNYQIDVVPIVNVGVPVDVTEEMSRQIITKINQAFDDATGGQVRFSFRTLHPTTYSQTLVVHSSDVPTVTGLTPTPDPGFEKAFLVGVMAPSAASKFAGEAFGNYVLMNGYWSLEGAWVLTHELGHNLGLMHANSAACTTQLPMTCEIMEYGDYSSTMGRYMISFASSPMVSRFSATELDKLKLLPKESRSIAIESGDYKLAPVYSTGLELPKVLYIPIGSELAYSVEYRLATGNESGLSETKVYLPGGNRYYGNIPSYGLQLRILKTNGTQFKELLPTLSDYQYLGTALVVPSLTADQVQPIGKVFTLSDGTTVTFLNADPNTGATVRVERSVDKDPPVALDLKPRWVAGDNYFNTLSERIIYKKNSETWDYPIIEIPLHGVTDNRLVKTVQIEVNDEIIGQVDSPALNGVQNFSYQTTKPGKFTFRLIATDYAGLTTSTKPASLSTIYNVIDSPYMMIYPGTDATNSVLVSVTPVTKSTKYVLDKLSSGNIVSTVEKDGTIEFLIKNLARNQKFTAQLSGTDELGYSDSGSEVTYDPATTECTNKKCYVGYQWNVETGYWTPGVGNLTLQEKVKNKWVNIQTAKPVPDPNGIMKKYVTFIMKVKYKAAGKHTYRFSMGAGKKYSSLVLSPFTQVVSPP